MDFLKKMTVHPPVVTGLGLGETSVVGDGFHGYSVPPQELKPADFVSLVGNEINLVA